MKNIVIGIEGEVGAGKTSLCRELLDIIPNSMILHGGNLYRGIVYAIKQSKLTLIKVFLDLKFNKKIDIKQLMDKLKVEIKLENRESVIYVNGKKIDEEKLQDSENSMDVSKVAKKADNSKLYAFGKDIINEYLKEYNVIVSGRDLLKIYPELDYHFFVTADLETRVQRKLSQYENEKVTKQDLLEQIKKRDKLQKQSGFYDKSEKTITVDVTECKSAKESAQKLAKYINFIEVNNGVY